MKIERVHVEGFGKFENFSFPLKSGLNIIFGGNAAGKTTLANFIRYCLTGELPELENYRPWFSNRFGGYLETSEGRVEFGQGRLDPELFSFTSFISEGVDNTLNGSKKVASFLMESYRNRPEAVELERILNEDFSVLMKKTKELEAEISNLKERVEAWKEKRRSLLLVLKRKKELSRDLQEKRRLLEEEIDRFESEKSERLSSIEARINEMKAELLRVEKELEEIERKTAVSEEKVREAIEIAQKLDYLRERGKELEKEIESLEEKSKDTEERLKTIMKDFSVSSLEELKLKLENMKLQIELVENEQKAKLNEIIGHLREPLREIDEKLEETQAKIENTGDDMKRFDKTLSIFRIFVAVFLTFALVSIIFAFLKSGYLFFYLTLAGTGASVVSMWNYYRLRRKLFELESELMNLSTQKRSLIERKNQIVSKLKETAGVDNIEELEKFLRDQIVKKVFERIPFLSKYGSEPRKAVENVEEQMRELLILKSSVEASLSAKKKNLEELQEYSREQEEVLKNTLKEIGVDSEDELKVLRDLLERRANLRKTRDSLEKEIANFMKEKEEIESSRSNARIEELKREVEQIESELEKLVVSPLEEPFDVLEALFRKKVELEIFERAIGYIPEFKDRIKKEHEELLRGYTRDLAVELTDVYRRFFKENQVFKVSPDLMVTINVPEEKKVVDVLNTSALKLLSFQMKRFISRVLEVESPLVVDNTFVDLDDEKIDLLWQELKEVSKTRQVVLFTSDRRLLKEEPVLKL
ncbi:MAG TPA: hypothetical protein DDW32_03625 [Thermotoga sp.]|uniref:ATP-binding protein n=1 Tax=Thermotoga sp. (strain RQ2) TaxID=126740 RepID=UPI00016DF0B1|nr:AAA family ATPase [Thermotoga sp. RQ2]ACB08756.1 conserved hypothetical protein [Thermotoga sp. RQ2]HBF69609.1 hypothetical protein [Thermotoga sp.]